MTKIAYLILDKNFIKNGKKGGQASHAQGVFEGLKQNGVSVSIVGPHTLKKFIPEVTSIPTSIWDPLGLITAYRGMKSLRFSDWDYVLIRKSKSAVLLYYLTLGFMLLGGKDVRIVWEVNNFSQFTSNSGVFKFANAVMFKVNLFLLCHSYHIYVVTDALRARILSSNKIDSKKVSFIPNGGPRDLCSVSYAKDSSDILKLYFFGVFKPYNNFNRVVESVLSLSGKGYNLELHFVGYGDEESLISSYVKTHECIKFHGSMTLEEFASSGLIGYNSVGIIPMEDRQSMFRSPVKLFEYISLGMRVLISEKVPYNVEQLERHVIRKYALTDTSILDEILLFYSEKNDWQQNDAVYREIISKNNWQARMNTLLEELNRV